MMDAWMVHTYSCNLQLLWLVVSKPELLGRQGLSDPLLCHVMSCYMCQIFTFVDKIGRTSGRPVSGCAPRQLSSPSLNWQRRDRFCWPEPFRGLSETFTDRTQRNLEGFLEAMAGERNLHRSDWNLQFSDFRLSISYHLLSRTATSVWMWPLDGIEEVVNS